MTSSKLAVFAMPIVVVGMLAANCSSTNLTPPKHDSGTDVPVTSPHDSGRDTTPDLPKDAAGDAPMTLPLDSGVGGAGGHGGCSGHTPDPSEVPPVHRATAAACPATPFLFADAGGTCTVNADCPVVPLSVYSTCLHGQCAQDQCLTDADCQPNEVCTCNDSAGPGAGGRRNSCVPAQCHVDADCGPNGYCSPSFGYCGGVGGYFCHGPSDTCVDGSKDCACGQGCQHLPGDTAFRCAAFPICAG